MMKLFLFAAAALLAAPALAIPIEKVESPGGITAWLVEDHSNPLISVDFSFGVGHATDPEGKEGLSSMVAALLDEGAGDLDSQSFHAKLEDLASGLSFNGGGEDDFTGGAKTLTENAAETFRLLHLALAVPRFAAEDVTRVKAQFETALRQEEQEPNAVAARAFAAALFPHHPYGRSSTVDSIKAVTEADLKAWIPAHLSRDRLMIGVVGDITPAQLAAHLDAVFGFLPARLDLAEPAEATIPAKGATMVIRRAIPQSVIEFAEPGIKRNDPDWYSAYVMNYILGGGSFSSRLMTEVRVKRGLAYGAYTSLLPYRHAGVVEGELATRNDKAVASLDVVKGELRRIAASDVGAEELRSAKTYLNGQFPLQMDSTGSIARILVAVQRDHLGIDYFDRRAGLIGEVSAADVHRVAARLLDPAALSVVVVGNPQGMDESR